MGVHFIAENAALMAGGGGLVNQAKLSMSVFHKIVVSPTTVHAAHLAAAN
jgi:hypothetical protein